MNSDRYNPDNGVGDIYTPSELNHEARLHLEAGFGRIWVEGEISNMSRPASGHIYFSLKDEKAQISCALFRSNAYGMDFKPENGMLVQARGRVSLFEARGNYQLIADSLVRSGEGLLRAKFELLKNSLASEGLFSESIKKPLPAFPTRIAVVSSPSGAALRDILNVLQRRWPLATVRVYGVPVQGVEAAPAIVDALLAANQHQWAEVIVAGRGGGSLEDLWAFNEEPVARAIHASEIPVVSAVGHEIDFSISDFVADLRAPTPSAAAELISPDQRALKQNLALLRDRLQQRSTQLLQQLSQKLDHLAHRLVQQHPGQRLAQHRKMLQQASQRLLLAGSRIVPQRRQYVQELGNRRLLQAGKRIVPERRLKLNNLERTLNAVGPLPTLARGYAIVTDAASGKAVSSVGGLKEKQALVTQLHDGQVHSTTSKIIKKSLDRK
ncbi:MAG: exodeoxyribonuclease VII large subunit [Xanthomonadales bacterium]|nr:exodeoxyribonuclease VII large subunit [Xanthomonadales bacterium]